MPKLHDMRVDFRMGRTGHGLRTNMEARAYSASVYDADNMMVLSDGRLKRRWGTLRTGIGFDGEVRLEGWKVSELPEERFLLAFESGKLTIYDATLAERAELTSCPWDGDTMWFASLAAERETMVIADRTFRTRLLQYDAESGSFTLDSLEFEVSGDERRLRAPFFAFADKDMRASFTIFTAQGEEASYGPLIAEALGIDESSFGLVNGTGEMTTDEDFFESGHVGTRLRVGDGELEVLSVTSKRKADVKIWRTIGAKLDEDPFYMRPDSKIVEVTAKDHGLKPGEEVFFYGISRDSTDEAQNYLESAALFPDGAGDTSAPGGTAATYTVKRVVGDNFFEIEGDTSKAEPQPLNGGRDVYMISASGLREVKEQAMSDVRGWPQAACIHETRLWLGGTDRLPDAVWGSTIGSLRNFDTEDGSPQDAVAMYSIGDQSRVRHLVPSFDLITLTDSGEFYTPGSTETAITQETARAIPATSYGAAFTAPQQFDMGIFFIDAPGTNIREMAVVGDERQYQSAAASVVVSDWVSQPRQSTVYEGSRNEVTPYTIFSAGDDGALLVMHSSRADEAFGFMRWTLKTGSFLSCTGLGPDLFAVAERDGTVELVRFDTSDGPERATSDFAEVLESQSEQKGWTAEWTTGVVQAASGLKVFSDIEVAADGVFETPEAVTRVVIGQAMPWLVETNAPISGSGQGPKAGKTQRLVSAEVSWIDTTTGMVNGIPALDGVDAPGAGLPTPVDDWRQYHVGEWGREPRLKLCGETPGEVALRALVMNVYF